MKSYACGTKSKKAEKSCCLKDARFFYFTGVVAEVAAREEFSIEIQLLLNLNEVTKHSLREYQLV